MRLAMIPPVVLLGVCLAFVPACKKKQDGGGGGGEFAPPPGPVDAPATVSSGYLLFAQLNAKEIRDSAIVTELKQAVLQQPNGTELWNKVEQESGEDVGFKLTDIDSMTACVSEIPPKGEPKYIVILTAAKPFSKTKLFGFTLKTPDARGLYPAAQVHSFAPPGKPQQPPQTSSYVHFPDEKTAVLVHADLAQKYLDGYGKDRKGWPMTAELSKAASGHTAFAVIQMDKFPAELRDGRSMKEFAPLLAAKTVTLTADLKGKELIAAGRVVFPDAAAAGKAKETVQQGIGVAVTQIEKFMNGKVQSDVAFLMPVVKEAHRALKDAKVDMAGPDLTVTGRYKADFDLAKIVAEGAKQFRETAPRLTAQNNLKQIGIGLHTYASVWQDKIPVHGVMANGPLKDAKDKPLLSWRVAILPFIGQEALAKQFKLNEPWDSEHNKKLIDKMPKIFAPVTKEGKPGYTHLQMVIGPGAMTPGKYMIGNIPDGTSNTIAVIEAADPVIWTKPDDVMLPAKLAPGDLKKKFGGQSPGGFNVLMWDGSVRFVRDTVSETNLRYAISPDDGQLLPFDWDEK